MREEASEEEEEEEEERRSISQRMRPKENNLKTQSRAGSTTLGEAESRARMRG